MGIEGLLYSRMALKQERSRLEYEVQSRYGPVENIHSLSVEQLEDALNIGKRRTTLGETKPAQGSPATG